MATRIQQNINGKFYVDINCINCSICAEIAPGIFTTNHDEGYEYIFKQPESGEEKALVEELIELCPASAIQSDGQVGSTIIRGDEMNRRNV